MNAIGISELWLVIISLLGQQGIVGITLPNQPEPDPAADAARFEAVTSQLDPGGNVYAYVSVDGDLTAIAGFVKSFMDDLRPLAHDVPVVNVPALLRFPAWTQYPQQASVPSGLRTDSATKPIFTHPMAVGDCSG
jgi:hypothetical protein